MAQQAAAGQGQVGKARASGKNEHQGAHAKDASQKAAPPPQTVSRDDKKRLDAEARRKSRAVQERRARIEALEAQIAETETGIRETRRTDGRRGLL